MVFKFFKKNSEPKIVETFNEVKAKDPDQTEMEKEKKYLKMYDYIYKYYKPKTDDFKNVVNELCKIKTMVGGVSISSGFTAISPNSFDEQIKDEIEGKLSEKDSIKNEKFGIFNEYNGAHIVKLYEDIKKFYEFFPTKDIEVTYKEILSIFKKIIDEEDLKELVDSYFLEIKDQVENKESTNEVLTKFVNYILEEHSEDFGISYNDSKDKLNRRYFKYVPFLLTKFGIKHDDKSDELRNIFNEIIHIIFEQNKVNEEKIKSKQLDDFEAELDSSYDNLLDEEIEKYDDVDDDLLSDYLNEDNNNKK